MNLKFTLFILLIVSFFSCSVPTKAPDNPKTEPEAPPVSTEIVAFNPDLLNFLLMPDRRRFKDSGFKLVNNEVNSNDLDNDGFLNYLDPFPLDSSFPAYGLASFKLYPKAEVFEKNLYNHSQWSNDNKVYNYYISNIGKNSVYLLRGTKEVSDGSSSSPINKITVDANSTKSFSVGFDKNFIVKNSEGKAVITLLALGGSSLDYFEVNNVRYENNSTKIPVDPDTEIVYIDYYNSSSLSKELEILIETEYYNDLNLFEAGEMYTGEIDGNPLIKDDSLVMAGYNLYTENNEFKEPFSLPIALPLEDRNTFLEKVLPVIDLIEDKFVTNSFKGDFGDKLFELLTGSEGSIIALAEFGNDSHFNLKNRQLEYLGLPPLKTWKTEPYSSFFSLSYLRGKVKDDQLHSKSINYIDNIVQLNPGTTDINTKGFKDYDYLGDMGIYLDQDFFNEFDMENLAAIKLVSVYENEELTSTRLFINPPLGFKTTFQVGLLEEKSIDVKSFKEGGFYIDEDTLSIKYNLHKDNGILKDILYSTRKEGLSLINQESFVRFIFILPYKDKSRGFYSIGTSVHFLGPPTIDTVVARYNSVEDKITDITVIPPELLIKENIMNDVKRSDSPWYQYFKNPDSFAHNIEIDRGDKLIMLQGVPMLKEFVNRSFPASDDFNWSSMHKDFKPPAIGGFRILDQGEYFNLTTDNSNNHIKDLILNNSMLKGFTDAYNYTLNIVDFSTLPNKYWDFKYVDLITDYDTLYPQITKQNSLINIKVKNLEFTELIPDMTFLSDDYLIPNTNESSRAFEITVNKVRNNGTAAGCDVNDIFEFISPVDPFWNADAVNDTDPITSNSNVLNNKGDGFYIYANSSNGSKILLSTLSLNPNKASILGASYFYTTAVEGNGQKRILNVDENNKLYYLNGGEKITSFSVKAYGNIRPGDDLRLSLKQYTSSNPTEITGTVPQSDKLQVYDKKMLWRANLYIDEDDQYNPTANLNPNQTYQDWNNRNPWNSTDNEWNRVLDGETLTTGDTVSSDISQLPVGNGGQTVRLTPFRWHNNSVSNADDNIVNRSVAYSVGAQDDPFSYNRHMLAQQPNVTPQQWNSYTQNTYIPAYSSYMWKTQFRIRKRVYSEPVANIDITTATPTTDILLENCLEEDIYDRLDFYEAQLTPAEVPFTLITDHEEYSWWYESAQSAGVDCVGFIYRVAAYQGNNYLILDLPAMEWVNTPDPHPGNKYHNPNEVYQYIRIGNVWRRSFTVVSEPDKPANLWEIVRYSDSAATKAEMFKNVAPGDILYYPGHVMIINSVESPDENIQPSEIEMIEATWDDFDIEGRVFDEKTLQTYQGREWIMGRLRTN